MPYDHKTLEQKWQKIWEEQKSFHATDFSKQAKFYVLVEFPYPSGDGLHVGHCRSYTALDIVARKKRMEGKNVLFPIGFDAFGLPTENYAIKHKIHPRVATDKNIANFTRQLKSVGFSFDWERVIDTTNEKYYQWTQWIFLQFFQAGLAYQAEIPINWCPSCRIGLANEEVVAGKCERCGAVTEQRRKKQWMLAITQYAERLLNDLDTVDYLPRIKTQQQNWIGKSEGTEINFQIANQKVGDLVLPSYPQLESDVTRESGLYLVTWNTVTPDSSEKTQIHDGTKTNLILNGGVYAADNDTEDKNFLPGLNLIDNQIKALTILKAFREAEANSKNVFCVLEAVVTVNHVHAVIAINNENTLISKVLNRLKGVSSRRFFEHQAVMSPAVNGGVNRSQAVMSPAVNGGVSGDIVSHVTNDGISKKIVNDNSNNPNGAVYGAESKHDKNNKKLFNHLWRSGYHFSHLSSLKSFQNAIGYIRGHKEKSNLAELYTDLPINITVFTTRADTLFGVTYVTLAPEHSLIEKLKPKIKNWDEVVAYQNSAKQKSELERTELAKEKTGVELKGVRVVNPINGEEVPIFIADYVLATYGTGAVMAVPAHDERDFEFAQKFSLPIRRVITKDLENKDYTLKTAFTEPGILIESREFTHINSEIAKQKITESLEKKGLGKKTTNYKLRDWVFSRQRYWGEPIPIVHCEKCGVVPLPEKDLPLTLPHVENYEPTDTGESPLSKISEWVNTTCPVCGGPAKRETDTMPNWAGSSWYFLRYIDPQNEKFFADQKKLDYWTPVDLYNGGMEHTVLHLLYSRFWHKFLFDQNLVPTPEPYKRRVSHGMILGPDGEKMSKSRGNVINPDSIVVEYGADTLRCYEMFIGPFDQAAPWSTQGVEGVRRFLDKVWRLFERHDTTEINSKFQIPNFKKISKFEIQNLNEGRMTNDQELTRTLHQSIKKIGEDIENFRFNTAISQLMILVNAMTDIGDKIPKTFLEIFMRLLAPFAPHLAEELWQKLGQLTPEISRGLIARESWPTYDEKLLIADTLTLAVQVNGKLRDTLEIPVSATKEEVLALAKASEKIQKWLENKTLVKEIFVPGKLVSFVVKE